MDLQEFLMCEARILEDIEMLKAENEKLKKQIKKQQYKKELNYGQGYKAYATEKGVFTE